MSANNTTSTFDFLLADQPQSRTPHLSSPVKAENLDWLYSDSDVLAPHPDAFELELESIAALSALDADFATLPAFSTADTFNSGDFNLYTQYRSAPVATSAYSGYGGAASTITVSSESLSTYGSTYEAYERISDQHAAAYSGAQHNHSSQLGSQQAAALASLFPELDLSAFNLAGSAVVSANAEHSMVPPRLTLDNNDTSNGDQNTSRSRGSSSAYDSASPSYDGTDFASYLANAGVPATYSATQQAQNHRVPATGSAPNVPHNGNSALVTPVSDRDNAPDVDPRKKYQCPTCPRSFARAFNLKTHMATHDPHRVKSFVCRHSGCGRSFSRKHDLGRHLVSIHQDASLPATESSSTSPVATGSGGSIAGTKGALPSSSKVHSSSSTIGVGASDSRRVWCDSCGRGWLAGSRDACGCDSDSKHEN